MSEFEPPVAMIELLMGLRARGIQSRRLLAAMERKPGSAFVDERYSADAYRDQALPIPCGQTISQPYIVAFMIEALQIEPAHTVLEIGTGSGYQTAILSQLARDGRLAVVESIAIEAPKTKLLAAKFKAMGLGTDNANSVLVIADQIDENLALASRNLANVLVVEPRYADPLSLVFYKKVLVTKGAIEQLKEMFA